MEKKKETQQIFIKKSLAIFSLTCCEGCQFELLKDYVNFNHLLNFYELKNFRLGQENNLDGPFDVAVVEGTPESQREYKLLHQIRRESKIVVAMGACANLGGIQSQRNHLPAKYIGKPEVKTLYDTIKIDFSIPGCPITNTEAISILVDLYWDKIPKLPGHAVCFECRLNENECLIKKGLPCLGPITVAGCNSICINSKESCFGCRGPLPQANFIKMKEILSAMLSKKEIDDWLTIYGDYQKKWLEINKRDKS